MWAKIKALFCGNKSGEFIYNDKLIVFVGRSGSGKTTLMKALASMYGYNLVKSYTTRKQRNAEDVDHTFFDIDKFDLDKVLAGNALALTYFDENYYWITMEQLIGKGISLVALDPAGAAALERSSMKSRVHVIALKTNAATCMDRMDARGDSAKKIMDRLEHDDAAFKSFMCDTVIATDNKTVTDVMFEVNAVIAAINSKSE